MKRENRNFAVLCKISFHLLFCNQRSLTFKCKLASTDGDSFGSTGPEVKQKTSCSTQLRMIFLLINVKMPTVVGIFTFMSRKNSILGLTEPEKSELLDFLCL